MVLRCFYITSDIESQHFQNKLPCSLSLHNVKNAHAQSKCVGKKCWPAIITAGQPCQPSGRPSVPSWGATESVGYHRSIRPISVGQAKQHIPQTLPVTASHTLKQHTPTKHKRDGWVTGHWGSSLGYLPPSFNAFFQLGADLHVLG